MKASALRAISAMAVLAALCLGSAAGIAADNIVHTMRFGDSLALLSKIYGATTESIRAANPDVQDWSFLRIGDMIVIPVARSFTPSVTTPFFYVVQPGETSTDIANKFEVDHQTLARANGTKFYPFSVTAGQTILIPAGPHIHVVQSGETLSGIAAAFGTNPELLTKVNNLSGTTVITGQRLFIPFLYNAQPLAPGGTPITLVPAPSVSGESATPTPSVVPSLTSTAAPGNTSTARPTATPTRTKAPTATRRGAASATPVSPGSTGGPLEIRTVFVETMDLDPSREGGAIAHMRLEFRGGIPPFNLYNDDVLIGTKLYPGWRLDFGVIYSTLHYDQLTTCDAVITHTIKLASADGQVVSWVYYIGPFSCPPPTFVPVVTRTPGP